jgi:DNA (cytosine-5)-methyltransferase 1
MKFISLFAGIGGFDLGLERAGMQCVGQVEIDKKCQAVLAKHWPNVKRMGDIREVKGDEFGPVDLICGGFPCQPFSHAGKRKGEADNRYLWPEMVRVIAAVGPAWVLGENVAGIISMALDKVHSDLESIGYQVQSFIIPACAVDAPHRRDRVWIVAHSKHDPRCSKRRIEQGGEMGRGPSEKQNTMFERGGNALADAQGVGGGPRLYKDRPKCNGDQSSDCRENVSNSGGEGLQRSERGGALYDEGSPAHGSTSEFCEDVSDDGLRSSEGQGSSECGRSQPARWLSEPDVGRVAHGIPHRVDRLKQLGNAVVPQVVEEIGRAIMKTEENARAEYRRRAGEHHATGQAQNAGSK